MNERDQEQEENWHFSSDNIRKMKLQLDKLSGFIGDLVEAIKGNDLGHEGLLSRLSKVEDTLHIMDQRLKEMEVSAKKREFYLLTIFTLLGALMGMAVKAIIDIFKK